MAFLKKNNVAYDERYIWDWVSFAPAGLAHLTLGCNLSPPCGSRRAPLHLLLEMFSR